MTIAVIILALMQPVTIWLTALIIHRARHNQSPALKFPQKVEVGGEDEEPETIYSKGRNIL